MLVRLSRNTIYRNINGHGYLTNQLNRHDQFFNELGTYFLNEIGREPISVDSIVDKLYPLYCEMVSKEEFTNDLLEFLNSLKEQDFVVCGDSPNDLDKQDKTFSYASGNPKSFITDISENTGVSAMDLMSKLSKDRPRINGLQFELTSQCNERCIHCYIPNAKKNEGKGMPTKKVLSLIDEYADMGGISVNLSGGEVFMHKDLIKIILYCREKDLQVNVLSNLIALRDSQIPYLKEANISMLQTSLYSMNPEIHDNITTIKGSFAKTKSAIEKLVAADIPVQISCPIMKANKNSYKDVLQYAKKLDCKAQTDFIMMAQANLDTSNLANRISLEETEKLIIDIIENDLNYQQAVLNLSSVKEIIRKDPDAFGKLNICSAGSNICCIAENGDVYPCPGWQDMIMGNVYEQSLKDIWEKSDKAKYLRTITQEMFPKCMNCDARDYCSPCLVRNYNENNGDMFKITQHFCDVAFLTKRIVEDFLGH